MKVIEMVGWGFAILYFFTLVLYATMVIRLRRKQNREKQLEGGTLS